MPFQFTGVVLPGDLQLPDIAGVDLLQCREFLATRIAAVMLPLLRVAGASQDQQRQ